MTEEHCSKQNCAFCDIMNRPPVPPELFFRNGWSYNDLARLEVEYPFRTAHEIGEILNRSAYSVWSKAKELGIKKYNV